MEVKTIKEEPICTLFSGSYNGSEIREIYAGELKNAKVGALFEVEYSGCCGRDVYDESLKVVYKDDEGVACVKHKFQTTDGPNPVSSKDSELIWFDLNRD